MTCCDWTPVFTGVTNQGNVIPAEAGIQSGALGTGGRHWTPVFTGVTGCGVFTGVTDYGNVIPAEAGIQRAVGWAVATLQTSRKSSA